VEFEWDPTKAEANLRKHGIAVDFASRVFSDPNRIEQTDEDDYDGEIREQVIGRVHEFVLYVVYTMRLEKVRIISARRATRNEYLEYWNVPISS
jgi:uncharacterized DUF497 family protein